MRTPPDVPSLAQMIIDGQESDRRIRRASKESLDEWFKQSERLTTARMHYGLRGDAFVEFASQIGIDRSSAFDLVKLWKHRTRILQRCIDAADVAARAGEPFHYPGWRTALAWFEEGRRPNTTAFQNLPNSDERPVPQFVFDWIAQHFGPFDLDVAATDQNAKCEKYFTKQQDGLSRPWFGNVWLNPPYSNIRPWAQKAWDYAHNGPGSVTALLPVWTDTSWFAEFATHGHITLLRGRIRFPHGTAGSAPFPNMIVAWGKSSARRGGEITVRLSQLPKCR